MVRYQSSTITPSELELYLYKNKYIIYHTYIFIKFSYTVSYCNHYFISYTIKSKNILHIQIYTYLPNKL